MFNQGGLLGGGCLLSRMDYPVSVGQPAPTSSVMPDTSMPSIAVQGPEDEPTNAASQVSVASDNTTSPAPKMPPTNPTPAIQSLHTGATVSEYKGYPSAEEIMTIDAAIPPSPKSLHNYLSTNAVIESPQRPSSSRDYPCIDAAAESTQRPRSCPSFVGFSGSFDGDYDEEPITRTVKRKVKVSKKKGADPNQKKMVDYFEPVSKRRSPPPIDNQQDRPRTASTLGSISSQASDAAAVSSPPTIPASAVLPIPEFGSQPPQNLPAPQASRLSAEEMVASPSDAAGEGKAAEVVPSAVGPSPGLAPREREWSIAQSGTLAGRRSLRTTRNDRPLYDEAGAGGGDDDDGGSSSSSCGASHSSMGSSSDIGPAEDPPSWDEDSPGQVGESEAELVQRDNLFIHSLAESKSLKMHMRMSLQWK